MALSLLRALSKEQLLDLAFLIYSKAPRGLAAAGPHWVGVNYVGIDDDGDENSAGSDERDDYYNDDIDSDHETSTQDKDAAAWSPKSLISCPSLSLPPWRQQALDDDQQIPASVNSAGSKVGSDKELSSKEDEDTLSKSLLLVSPAESV